MASNPAVPLTYLPHCPLVEPDEITGLINKLKMWKLPRPDGIPAELLKFNVKWWSQLLVHLFTSMDQSGVIPDSWLNLIIIPIFKKSDPDSSDNYRPISLLDIIGKLNTKHLKVCGL